MRTAFFVAALGVASTAIAQIPLPPFGSTYTAAATRGYWFQAPANFVIGGLSVPNESLQPFQVVEVIDLGLTPPPAYPTTVIGTQLFYSNNTAGGSLIPTAIPCVTGNYYGVLGACTSSVGSTTSYNSYSSAAGVFASNILGIPTTLTRFGTQFGIGAGGNQPVWQEPAGTFCRVDLYAVPSGGGTFATNTTLGTGCVRRYASFYENFATSAAFDLSGTVMTMIPTGSGYIVIPGGGAFLPVGSVQATPTVVANADDVEQTVPFTVGSFPGWNGVTVCSNGFVSKATGNGTSFTPTPAAMLAGPQDWFSLCWHDFNPATVGSGQIKYEESSSVTMITWDGVWDFGGTSASNANTMQIQLYPSGIVTMAYGVTSTLGGGRLVGYSPGGPNADPGNTDISAALVAGPITLSSPDVLPLTLAAGSRPVTGTNWNLNVGNISAPGLLGVDIFGVADPAILDLSLLGLGQPGCQLRSTLDALSAYVTTGATHAYSFAIPNNPALVNFHLFTQSAILGLPSLANTLTTGGIDGKIGDL